MKTIINITGTLSEVRKHLKFEEDDELLYKFCEDKNVPENSVIQLNSSHSKAFVAWNNNGVKDVSYFRIWPVNHQYTKHIKS